MKDFSLSPRPSPIRWERERSPTRLAGTPADYLAAHALRFPSPVGRERVRVRGFPVLSRSVSSDQAAMPHCLDAAHVLGARATGSRASSGALQCAPTRDSRSVLPGCLVLRGMHLALDRVVAGREGRVLFHPVPRPASLRGSKSPGSSVPPGAGDGTCNPPAGARAISATNAFPPMWSVAAIHALAMCGTWPCGSERPPQQQEQTQESHERHRPSPRPSPIRWERESSPTRLAQTKCHLHAKCVALPLSHRRRELQAEAWLHATP